MYKYAENPIEAQFNEVADDVLQNVEYSLYRSLGKYAHNLTVVHGSNYLDIQGVWSDNDSNFMCYIEFLWSFGEKGIIEAEITYKEKKVKMSHENWPFTITMSFLAREIHNLIMDFHK